MNYLSNKKQILIENMAGYVTIIGLWVAFPFMWWAWILLIFAHFYWLYRLKGPREPELKYTFQFKMLGASGSSAYINTATNIILICSIATTIPVTILINLLLFPLYMVTDLMVLFLFVSLGGTFLFFERYYSKLWGMRLHEIYAKKYLKKLWSVSVKDCSQEEKIFLKNTIKIDEPLDTDMPPLHRALSSEGRIAIAADILSPALADKLISNKIIRKHLERDGMYYIPKWVEDYVKLNKSIFS